MLQIYNTFTSFQEVPDELSVVFSCCGCPLKCYHCSWENNPLKPFDLSAPDFKNIVDKYADYVSCICFLGGEWNNTFENYLMIARTYSKLKVCLYSGYEWDWLEKNTNVLNYLDYVKTGPYIESLGGLASKSTNQKFFDVKTKQILNYKFWKD